MRLRIFQLNILKGLYLDRIIAYLKTNSFDIICLQEVTGGKLGKNNTRDCFEELKRSLAYQGQISCDLQDPSDLRSYFGNAILYQKSFQAFNSIKILSLPNQNLDYQQILSNPNWATIPRHCFGLTMRLRSKIIQILTTHSPWTEKPIDTPEKIRFAQKITDYLQTLTYPFILTGDFNMTSSSKTIQIISAFANNLTDKYRLNNTLNPHIHYAKDELFPPGLAVDYIFTFKNLKSLFEKSSSNMVVCKYDCLSLGSDRS